MLGGNKKRAAIRSSSGFAVSVWQQCQLYESRRLDGGQDSKSSCPGNRTRPGVDTEFTGKLKPTCVAKAPTLEIVLSPECDYVR